MKFIHVIHPIIYMFFIYIGALFTPAHTSHIPSSITEFMEDLEKSYPHISPLAQAYEHSLKATNELLGINVGGIPVSREDIEKTLIENYSYCLAQATTQAVFMQLFYKNKDFLTASFLHPGFKNNLQKTYYNTSLMTSFLNVFDFYRPALKTWLMHRFAPSLRESFDRFAHSHSVNISDASSEEDMNQAGAHLGDIFMQQVDTQATQKTLYTALQAFFISAAKEIHTASYDQALSMLEDQGLAKTFSWQTIGLMKDNHLKMLKSKIDHHTDPASTLLMGSLTLLSTQADKLTTLINQVLAAQESQETITQRTHQELITQAIQKFTFISLALMKDARYYPLLSKNTLSLIDIFDMPFHVFLPNIQIPLNDFTVSYCGVNMGLMAYEFESTKALTLQMPLSHL